MAKTQSLSNIKSVLSEKLQDLSSFEKTGIAVLLFSILVAILSSFLYLESSNHPSEYPHGVDTKN